MRDDTAMQVSGGSFPPCVAPPVLLPTVGMDRDARCRGRAISHRRMDGLGDDTRTRLTAPYNSSTSINPCITCPDDPCIIKDKKQMRVTGMLNTVILSEAASQNFEQGMSRQQGQTENLRR